MREPKRPVGRPAVLSRHMVLDAAMALLESDGIGSVSIRGVARRLHVSPMALYRHVADKDELLVALVETLASELRFPERPDNPREAIIVLWVTLYDGLSQRPWMPELLARHRLMATSVLDAVEEIHARLLDVGLSIEQAVSAYRIMWHFTLGTLLTITGVTTTEDANVQRQLRGNPDPGRYPTLAAAAPAWTAANRRDTYRTDLTALLCSLTPPGVGTTSRRSLSSMSGTYLSSSFSPTR